MADLPPGGWQYEYLVLEQPRRGRDVLRPAVPISFGSTQSAPVAALVDSGSEHNLAAGWLAHHLDIDLSAAEALELGFGGRTATARFVTVELRLLHPHDIDQSVTWMADVGFIEPWPSEFFVLLGQVGFFDEFTVSMSRSIAAVVVEHREALWERQAR